MSGTRWAFVAAALAAVGVLVAPAAAQRTATPASLAWYPAAGGAAIYSYSFGVVAPGSHVSKSFKLENSTATMSGPLAIKLIGSPAFSIAANHCQGKSIAKPSSCSVTIAYAPRGAGASNSAVLTATGTHGAAATLNLFGDGHVYWINRGNGTVQVVPLGGGTVTTLASSQPYPHSIAVDHTYVYWLNAGNGSPGTVNKVPLGGGTVTILGSPAYGAYQRTVAVDGTNVYWSSGHGELKKVPIGGGTVTILATGQGPTSVAVDGTNVYWTTQLANDGQVNEIPSGGGTVTTLATGQNVTSVATDGTYVYWVDIGTSPNYIGTVNKVPVGGGTVTTLATGQTIPISVAVNGKNVYWANDVNGGTVNMVPVGGGRVTTLASHQGFPDSIAVDRAHVYWTNRTDEYVNAVPITGGRVIHLAHGLSPWSVAVGP